MVLTVYIHLGSEMPSNNWYKSSFYHNKGALELVLVLINEKAHFLLYFGTFDGGLFTHVTLTQFFYHFPLADHSSEQSFVGSAPPA